MLTVIPPAVLLALALIYLPYSAYYLWRIHSAQAVIRRNHALPTTTWAFQSREYEENRKQFTHYRTFFCVSLWIAICCFLELSFGHHTRFMPLDYCILCVGSLGAVGLYMALHPGSDVECHGCTRTYGAGILFFCAVYAFSWEFGLILALFGGIGWLLPAREA